MADGDSGLRYWFLDKRYTNMYLMCGGTHQMKALKLEICQWTAARSLVFERWHNLELFAASPNNFFRHYVFVFAFLPNWAAPHNMCIPSLSMFVYCFSSFGYNAKRFGYLLLQTAMKESTIMFLVCFSQAAEYDVAGFFDQLALGRCLRMAALE